MWKEENNCLTRMFQFEDFDAAWEFMQQVALLAKNADHHPWWSNNYNIVEIRLTTHSLGKIISDKDRQMASEIDQLLRKNTN